MHNFVARSRKGPRAAGPEYSLRIDLQKTKAAALRKPGKGFTAALKYSV